MKDNSFEKAMSKIVGQHEAEQQAEIRAQKRSEIFGKVRAAVIFLALAAVLVMTYNFRNELTAMILPKPAPLFAITGADGTNGTNATAAAPNTPQGQTASALKAAQQNAATRDAIIDSIAK